MKIIRVFLLFYFVVSCTRETSVSEVIQDSTNSPPVEQFMKPRPYVDTIYSSETVVVFGDTTIDESKISVASIKFEPYISFNDFRVDSIYTGRNAPLDLASRKGAKRYKTMITEGYESQLTNFAGHYIIASWGCGAPCHMGYLMDRTTGKVYNIPYAELGYDFRQNSRMLIVNPPDSLGFYNDFFGKPSIYVWDEETKQLVKKHPN